MTPSRHAVVALDQGSSRSRAVLFGCDGAVIAHASAPIQTYFPRSGWVEHDPDEILQSALTALRTAVRRGRRLGKEAVALGIANQRSTLLCWDKKSGKALGPAISWQDRRTDESLSRWRRPDFVARTGLPLTPYYAATKLAWLLNGFRTKGRSTRNLLCGTVNTFLIWHLTGGKVHRTDPANAARMLLYRLDRGDWDPVLLRHFGVPRAILPEISPVQSHFGEALIDGRTIPITCSIGDQQASLAGLGGLRPGAANINYGTGGFFLVNAGARRRNIPGLLSGVARSSRKKTSYLVEGTVNGIGPLFTWLCDLGLIRSEKEIDAACARSRERIVFIPAMIGLGAPHWDSRVKTALLGLGPATRKEDIVRGAVEGVAFLMTDIYRAIQAEGNLPVGKIIATGGGSQIESLLQIQADLLGRPVSAADDPESTVRGAAFLAGEAAGVVDRKTFNFAPLKKTFTPRIGKAEREERYRRWQKALGVVRAFHKEDR